MFRSRARKKKVCAFALKKVIWPASNQKHLYFAFRCLDLEPPKIKSSISRRDQLFRDDWVGLSLDSMNNGQLSYDMFVNPNGVQADILTSSSSGEDVSPDWVWDSAGRLTDEGYNVEIRLPLQSIRFNSGSAVQMGLLFWRRVSRLGSSASFPPVLTIADCGFRIVDREVGTAHCFTPVRLPAAIC